PPLCDGWAASRSSRSDGDHPWRVEREGAAVEVAVGGLQLEAAAREHGGELGERVEAQPVAGELALFAVGRDDDEADREAAAQRVPAPALDDQRSVGRFALEGFDESGEGVLAVEQVEEERA